MQFWSQIFPKHWIDFKGNVINKLISNAVEWLSFWNKYSDSRIWFFVRHPKRDQYLWYYVVVKSILGLYLPIHFGTAIYDWYYCCTFMFLSSYWNNFEMPIIFRVSILLDIISIISTVWFPKFYWKWFDLLLFSSSHET